MSEKIPWGRAFVEGVVIVVSILLAFGVDTCWEERRDASRRAALLDGLLRDFSVATGELDRVSSDHSRGMAAASHLMTLRDSTIVASDAPRVDVLISSVYSAGSFDAPRGAIDALLNQGELGLLGDPELVAALTRWPAEVENLRRHEERLTIELGELTSYLGGHRIDTSDLVWGEEHTSGVGVPWNPRHTMVYELLADSQFRSLLGEVWFVYRNTRTGQVALAATLERIQELAASR